MDPSSSVPDAYSPEFLTAEDGLIGPSTVAEAARADPAALMPALRSELAAHYRMVAAKADRGHRGNNEKNKFIKRWLNRAYAR